MLEQCCCFEVTDQCYSCYVLLHVFVSLYSIQHKAFIEFLELLLSEYTDEVDLISPAGWVLFCFVRGDEKGSSL